MATTTATRVLHFIVCSSGGASKDALIAGLLSASALPPDDAAAERERAVMQDSVYRRFSTDRRGFAVACDPGHEQDLRNLLTGAATADLVVVVVDARSGIVTRTRHHSCLVGLLGIRHVVLAVDALGLVDDAASVFQHIDAEYRAFAHRIGLHGVVALPVSAAPGASLPWYHGPTLLQHLETVEVGTAPLPTQPRTDAAATLANQFQATIVWLHAEPLLRGRSYWLKSGSRTVGATVLPLKHRLNVDTLEHVAAERLELNEIGVAEIEADAPIAFDARRETRDSGATGGFLLVDKITLATVGAGRLNFALRRAGNIAWQALEVDKAARQRLAGHRSAVLWLTGLSGAGKSTIANLLEKRLHARGVRTYLLDGDNVRHGLNKDLGFTAEDRVENIRRVAEVARLMVDAGIVVIAAFISPFRAERRMARELMGTGEFIEVFVDTPLAVAEQRDVKGLYGKARRGELKNFTGIDSPYEAPEQADVVLDTTAVSAADAAEVLVDKLHGLGVLGPAPFSAAGSGSNTQVAG